MSIKVIKKEGKKLSLEVEGIPYYTLNAIRRKILNSVETAAVEYIDVIKNTSGLYNEMLAHRLAMVPFKFRKGVLISKDKCDCEDYNCPRCSVKFVIKKKGPANVYSKDIKVVHEDFKPEYDNILIVRLLEGQELDIEGIITLGTGKEHAKYTPAIIGYEEVEEGKYLFNVESISALDPKDIMLEAIDKLDEELVAFGKLI